MGVNRKKTFTVKHQVLTILDANNYATELGLFVLGFTRTTPVCDTISYRLYMNRFSYVNVYMSWREKLQENHTGIVVEVEYNNIWYKPQGRDGSDSISAVRLKLMRHLSECGVVGVLPYLRAQKIDELLKGQE